jgi:5-methyltetrahydropteroyltriglutamate--homocysteine methyltransferase
VQGTYRGQEKFRDKSGHTVPAPRVDVTGKIRWRKSVNVGPFRFLKSVTRGTPKVTMPAPQQLYHFATRDTVSSSAYPDLAVLWDDLADAYIAELKALGAAGCTYVQMDEVVTSCLCDDTQREKLRARGDDPDAFLGHYIRCMNRISAGRPKGMTLALQGKLPGPLDGGRRLRPGRRARVQRDQGRCVLPGVRLAARGQLRAAALLSE